MHLKWGKFKIMFCLYWEIVENPKIIYFWFNHLQCKKYLCSNFKNRFSRKVQIGDCWVGARNSMRADATKCGKKTRCVFGRVSRGQWKKNPKLHCRILGSRCEEFKARGRHKMWKRRGACSGRRSSRFLFSSDHVLFFIFLVDGCKWSYQEFV